MLPKICVLTLLCVGQFNCQYHLRTIPASTPKDIQPTGTGILVEQVEFKDELNTFSADFFRPARPGRYPAVALIEGSGRQDRTYGGMASTLGRYFARRGIACLTWDKPGVGRSTGDFNHQTLPDRANEAIAAVQYLRRRPDVRPDRVGIWGHSQGGIVAPLAAGHCADIAFIIEVSGWQGPAWQQDAVRVESELRSGHFDDSAIAEALTFTRRRMSLIRSGARFEELDLEQRRVANKPWFEHVHLCDQALFESAQLNVNYDTSGWWEHVRCPVLAVYGTDDTSSGPPGPLLAIISAGLERAGNRNVTMMVYPHADHLIQRNAVSPGAAHHSTNEEDRFVDGYLALMATWIAAR